MTKTTKACLLELYNSLKNKNFNNCKLLDII